MSDAYVPVNLLLTVDAEEIKGLAETGSGGLGDKYGGKITKFPIEIFVVIRNDLGEPHQIIGAEFSMEAAQATAQNNCGDKLTWEGEGQHYHLHFDARGADDAEDPSVIFDIIKTKLGETA